MTPQEAYFDIFYQEIASTQLLWTIQDEKGIPTPLNSEKIKAMPFWSSLDKAQAYIDGKEGYADFTTLEVSWPTFAEKWADGLWTDGLCAGVNWKSDSEKNYDVEAADLVKGVKTVISKK